MAEPREKEFVGIDPASLKAMNSDLAATQALIKSDLPALRKAFGKASIPLTPLDRLVAVGKWIEQELPMLQRRQTLAAQLQQVALQQGQTPLMVKTEWPGNFPSAEAAVARAKELAARYKEPGELPDDVWEEVKNNQHDPDFAVAFAKALGPHAGRMLVANVGHKSAKPDRLPALANLFATASHHKVFDDSWFRKFPAVPGILPLMRYGTWDNDLLVRVGTTALNANVVAGDMHRVTAVLEVVARSPIAASRVYQDNFDKIQAMSRGKIVNWTNGSDTKLGDPLGAFIHSATIDARSRYEGLRPAGAGQWSNPAEELTRRLIMDLKDNPTRAAFAGVQAAYSAIATEYFDDLRASIAGPPLPEYFNKTDPGRPGIEAPETAWQALVQQAMWDPKNAAVLSAFFGAKYSAGIGEFSGKDAPETAQANNLFNWQNGQVRGWFVTQFQAVQAAAQREVADYNARVKQAVDYVVDPMNAAVFATGGVSAAAGAAGKTITGFVKAGGVTSVKAMVISWFERKPPAYTVDQSWTNDAAVLRLYAKVNQKNIRSLTDAAGVTWSGDTGHYEKVYGAKFTDDEGKPVRDVSALSPAAQRAYIAWLEDPAVQQAYWDDFAQDVLGSQGR